MIIFFSFFGNQLEKLIKLTKASAILKKTNNNIKDMIAGELLDEFVTNGREVIVNKCLHFLRKLFCEFLALFC